MDDAYNGLFVPATVEHLDEVQSFIGAKLEQAGFSAKMRSKLAIAVEEIFVNIASYAYAPSVGSVRVLFELSRTGAAEITFIDSGKPYDPLLRQDPDVTLDADERGVGGLGIYMVKKSMDSLHYSYRDGQNRLTLIKNRG